MSSLFNLEDVPIWLMCTIFFGVSSIIAVVVSLVCCCERRRRIQRAVDHVEVYRDNEIEHMRSQVTPREEIEVE